MPHPENKQISSIFIRKCLPAAFLLTLFCFISIPAQYRFDSWTTDNGLPQVSINAILQTRDGFMWFTTFGGLVRYDGLRFQVFNAGNTEGLTTSRFANLFEDRDGNLWITTETQGITRYRDGKFTTYTTNDGLADNLILETRINAEGNMLLIGKDSVMEWTGEKFVPYYPPIGLEIARNELLRNPDGSVWYNDGDHLKKIENGQITVDFVPGFHTLRVMEDSQKRLWIAGDQGDGVYMLKDGKLTVFDEKDGFPPKSRFLRIIEDTTGRLLFCTPVGLATFDNGRFRTYTTADGLVDNRAQTIYQDREGTIWVGTAGGLSRLTTQTITPYSKQDGLAGDNVYPIHEDRRGRVWIGSWPGLTIFENGVFANISERYKLAGENVTSFLEDRSGAIWIGTWAGTVIRSVNDEITTWAQNEEQLGSHIRVIYEDTDGAILFGTTLGLVRYKDGKFTQFNNKDGLPGKAVYAIHRDKTGTLWIGTDFGLVRYRDGVFTPLNEKDGISPTLVRVIREDTDGTLWIGMYDNGLYRYKDAKFIHYTVEDGLYDSGVFQIIDDNAGNFWISCNLGIYRIKREDLDNFAAGQATKITAIPYNKRDGMLNAECNGGAQPPGIRARDGRIWFPTQKGVAVLDPKLVPFNSQPPPVVIESLLVDTKPVDIYSPVRIQPEQTNLEIHYSGLSFINPELVKFKYKLDGLDPDWTDASTRRTTYYTHLPPGKYTFIVIAANRDGVWNEIGTRIEIEILPPFWRTWWFWIFAGFVIVVIALAFYQRRTGMLKKAKATQEAFSLQLIESQESERKRIAVELHDSLGQSLVLIKNWALLGLKATPDDIPAKTNLNEISGAASEAINEVREIAYNLGPYQLDRLGLKTSIEEMIQKVRTSSPVKFRVEIDKIDGVFDKQTEINIFRIIQEAINNIVKHSRATSADLIVKLYDAQLSLTISDNGTGFPTESVNGRQKTGMGLFGISERVNLLKGEYIIRSEPGRGTTIAIGLRVPPKN